MLRPNQCGSTTTPAAKVCRRPRRFGFFAGRFDYRAYTIHRCMARRKTSRAGRETHMSKKVGIGARMRAAASLALGVAASAITATPALAQDAEDEIVVTATRRDQALQDVPIAVTPVTAEMIENSGIRDVQ